MSSPYHYPQLYSAGLLPPIVNAGMLIAYSFTYAPRDKRDDFYEMGNYSILFYATHVVTIVIVANIVFWLKDIDPRFREGEDSNFEDIPSLVEHRKRLLMKGEKMDLKNMERAKAEYFIKNIKDDIKEDLLDMKDKASAFAHIVTGGLIGNRNRSESQVPVSQRRHTDSDSPNNTDDNNIELEVGLHSQRGCMAPSEDIRDSNDAGTCNGSSKSPFSTLHDVDVGATVEADDDTVHNPVLRASGYN